MEIIHIANYKGDAKNGIDIVLNNIVKHSRFTNIIYPLGCVNHQHKIHHAIEPSLLNIINRLRNKKQIFVVFHSIYSHKTAIIYLFVRLFKIRYCIFPHSSLTIESQKKSKIRKTFFKYLLLDRMINNSSYINFLNNEEVLNSYINKHTYEIVGNGVDLGIRCKKENYISFLGRYDIIHKGIDVLLEALVISSNEIRNKSYKVIFRGVCEKRSDLEKIKKYITENKIDDFVDIGGPLTEISEKNEFLAKSKYYILTSRYEGLPITVLEALSNGTPVIITPGTNTTKIVTNNNLGYSAQMDPNSIAENIIKAINLNDREYLTISTECYNYAKKYLNWDNIVREHDNNYGKYHK
ncbi:glycosyltransferase [Escherichia coli]|nr:glycosyltransferase [Escherichia coli]EFA0789959.1 glycosyltransferase [Escherichia coli]EFE7889249.1 glycosyltransferase [Escherichia coli]EFK3075094.1 glycosyltransferase [Escherichia coli]EFK6301898.1 glycosyltransferase [Escherichia coli]